MKKILERLDRLKNGGWALFILVLCVFVLVSFAYTPSWKQLTKYGPSGRYDHGIAYDTVRKLALVFGGTSSSGTLGDFWKWDGTKWTKITFKSGPDIRTDMAMAYDPIRKVTVLFGGVIPGGTWSADTFYKDTWEWNGVAWKEISKSGPSGRRAHAMAYDSKRKKIILFGGYNGTSYLNDVWTYGATGWTKIKATGGVPKVARHSIVYDQKNNQIVMFGGENSTNNQLGSTWVLQGTKWTEASKIGPHARKGQAMAYYPISRTTILFGGGYTNSSDVYLKDTWEWNGIEWVELPISGPTARVYHGMVYDSKAKKIFLTLGAKGSTYLRNSWLFSQ